MRNNDIPPCALDAVRTVRQVEIDGATIGLSMLDLVFAEVQALDLADETAVRAELVRRVNVYNYVPAPAAAAYGEALYREYLQWVMKE